MSSNGLTTQQLFNTTAAAILADLRNKFGNVMTAELSSQPQGQQLITTVMGWYDKATQQVGAGAASIVVPVSGSAPASGPQGMNAGLAAVPSFAGAPNPFAQQQAQNPFGSLGGVSAAPQQAAFGAPAGFGGAGAAAFGGPAAPQAGNLPKGTAASRQACGRCLVPTSQPVEGAICGVAHNKNECKGVTLYCTAPATKQGASGYWTCSAHAKRPSPDLNGRGAKKSGGGGGAMVSPQQLTGLGRATGTPAGFGTTPMANQLAGVMAQQPPQFGQPSQFGQQQMPFGQQPQVVANQGLSQQLMNSVQGQVGGMQQQQPGFQPGFNVNNMLQGAAPNSLPVPGFNNPMLANIPQTPGFGGQAVASTVIATGGFDEGDEDDEEDGESTNEEGNDRPVPTADPAALQAAMQTAGFGGFQQPQFGLGQQAAAATNAFGQPAQQPQFQQQATPFGQQPQQQMQFGQPQQVSFPTPFAQQAPAPVSFAQAAAPNPLQNVIPQQQAPAVTPFGNAPAPMAVPAANNPLQQAMLAPATQAVQQPPAPAQAPVSQPIATPAPSNALADALKAATAGAPVGN